MSMRKAPDSGAKTPTSQRSKRAKTQTDGTGESSGESPAAAGTSTLVVEIDNPASESQCSDSRVVPAVVHENAVYMKKVQADVATVLEKVPELSKTSKPVTMEQGSDLSPWSIAEFMKHFKVRKSYRCAGNLSWIALTTPTPEIPLSEDKKNKLQTIMSKSPEMLTIRVHADKDWSEEELKTFSEKYMRA